MPQVNINQVLQAAMQHYQAGRLNEAEMLYRDVLRADAGCAHALHMLGLIAMQIGNYSSAAELIRRAVTADPSSFEAHNNLGNALQAQGLSAQAAASFRQAIAIKPDAPQTHYNLGNALRRQGNLEEAIECYQQAIVLRDDFDEAHNNIGEALCQLGRIDEGIACYRRAIAINPNHARAWNNIGNALHFRREVDEAIECFNRAIALEPRLFEAYSNLSIAFVYRGETALAIAAIRRAMELKPDVAELNSGLLFDLHYDSAQTPEEIYREHYLYNIRHAEPARRLILAHHNERSLERRLRIGYVSPDFRHHSVAHFALPLLEAHDPRQFEITCYATISREDDTTARFKARADRWRCLEGITDERACEMIRQDEIDILVDLAGHTLGNRLLVFARKPAPVQVTYLGYANTTGLKVMDYRFTDEKADPPGMTEQWHSEQLVCLPDTAWCFASLSVSPPTAETPALSNGYVTFGSFNARAKLSDTTLRMWAEILIAVPTSKLLIKNQSMASKHVRDGLQESFSRLKISPERLLLILPEASGAKHLEWYNQIDIALDNYPYHGTTTTCEGLWMGVPTVTLAGPSHVSRVGVSLLTTVVLEELIAKNPEDYVRIAAELANDVKRLSALRSTLRLRMMNSPLMDSTRFAQNVEQAYRTMWRTWCEGR